MMKLLQFIMLTSLFILGSCSNEESIPELIEECAFMDNAKILSEEEKKDACVYTDVFLYESQLYFLAECCVCDMVAMAPSDCDGIPLYDIDKENSSEFNQKLEYLFSIK